MNKLALLIATTSFLGAFASGVLPTNFQEITSKMVPNSKIIKQKKDEVQLQTPTGTIVEIEFDRTGQFEEASGDAAHTGDVFIPEGSLLSLAQVIESLQKTNKIPSGDWSFKNSRIHGWVYEIEGVENGQKMEYLLSAQDGKILKSKIDN